MKWVNLPGYDYDCLESDLEYVYFIRQGDTDAFKIGLTTVDSVKRLLALQTGNAEELSLAHVIYCFEFHAQDVKLFLHYTLHIVPPKNQRRMVRFRGQLLLLASRVRKQPSAI